MKKPTAKSPTPAEPFTTFTLVGMFFHSFKDGKINWQGRVLCSPEPGFYLVQTYSWFDGSPYTAKLVAFASMHGWDFFHTSEAMQDHYERKHCNGQN
jgi:hypothetical protein